MMIVCVVGFQSALTRYSWFTDGYESLENDPKNGVPRLDDNDENMDFEWIALSHNRRLSVKM